MVTAFAPGKMMLAGEWAILEPGNVCIALPLQRGVTVRVVAGIERKARTLFVTHAMDVVTTFLQESGVDTCDVILSIDSDISYIKEGVKAGLGSSAAVVVAVIKGMLQFHDVVIDTEKLFKLSYIAHYLAQGRMGSGYDVAVSAYQEPILYNSFDTQCIDCMLQESSLYGVVHMEWPGFCVTPLVLPKHMRVLIGFVGYSACTRDLVQQVGARDARYRDISRRISGVVRRLYTALHVGDEKNILLCIKENRDLLKMLADVSGVMLETAELAWMCDVACTHGGAAKFAGAGGGDCGIAVCFDERVEGAVKRAWDERGILAV